MKFVNDENISFYEIKSLNKESNLSIKKKERNSSFELLRIILISLIVIHHIFINTNSLQKLNQLNFKKIIYL